MYKKTTTTATKNVLRRPWGRYLKDVLKIGFDDVLKKGRRSFHFKPVFETKIKPVFWRLCNVFVSAG